ncbi:hypothetical protein H6G93_28365 [Nostoc sp. FACHB-973]|nr:hypothetical protein [Nostoc sp. FACHB-973]
MDSQGSCSTGTLYSRQTWETASSNKGYVTINVFIFSKSAWLGLGQVVGNEYTIDRKLGEGGFGITYRALKQNGHLL